MRRYRVYFQWNNRGRSTCMHIVNCLLPNGQGISDVNRGFWIDDSRALHDDSDEVDYALTVPAAPNHMWVPPGRITSVLVEEHP